MKRYRIMKIKEIIQNQVIETQEELAEALKKEGIAVTQATVSRDIKDLMLIKIPYKNGHYRYALSNEKQSVMSKSHTAILFQEAVVKIDSARTYTKKISEDEFYMTFIDYVSPLFGLKPDSAKNLLV